MNNISSILMKFDEKSKESAKEIIKQDIKFSSLLLRLEDEKNKIDEKFKFYEFLKKEI